MKQDFVTFEEDDVKAWLGRGEEFVDRIEKIALNVLKEEVNIQRLFTKNSLNSTPKGLHIIAQGCRRLPWVLETHKYISPKGIHK